MTAIAHGIAGAVRERMAVEGGLAPESEAPTIASLGRLLTTKGVGF